MAKYFTGTNTGNLYETGRSYSMNGDTYVANSNGSFTNTRSGVTLVGSSQSSDVSWYSSSTSGLSGSPDAHFSQSASYNQPALYGATQGVGAERAYVPQSGGGSDSPAQGTGPGNNGATNGPPAKAVPGVGGGNSTLGGMSTGVLRWQPSDQQMANIKEDGPWLKDGPLKRTGVGGQQEAPGAISDVGWARTKTGWIPVPSQDVKERIEDNMLLELGWVIRNDIAPRFWEGQEFRPEFLDERYSHYMPYANEWREGGNPRAKASGELVFTGGGF